MKVHKQILESLGAPTNGEDFAEIEAASLRALIDRFRLKRGQNPPAKKRDAPPDPSPLEMAQNFGKALSKWAAAGFETVDRETYDLRMQTCRECPHWDGAARFGLGKCRAPGCGCSKFKHWLATEKCPLGKWKWTQSRQA